MPKEHIIIIILK